MTANFMASYVCDERSPDACAEADNWHLKGGRLWGSITFEPDAFDGGWQGTFNFVISSLDEWGFSYSGEINARGYGELEGLQLRLEARTDATIPPWEGSHTVTGYVLVPAA